MLKTLVECLEAWAKLIVVVSLFTSGWFGHAAFVAYRKAMKAKERKAKLRRFIYRITSWGKIKKW